MLNNIKELQNVPKSVATFAAGVELQHLFMLVHDDIMDKATFRRGEPTLLVVLSLEFWGYFEQLN